MEHSFNLVDKKFIPCRWLDGRDDEVPLRDALLRAPEIREIRDDSPLVTIALHRFLLAILHRTLGPPDLAAWGRTWSEGRFDPKPVGEYLDKWRHRFDLCDSDRPFYQATGIDDANDVSVWRLALVQANNATLFDHRVEHEDANIPAALAARLLVAYQAFAIGGGVSQPFNFMHSPMVREGGFLVLLTGDNLFETLWLNAVCYDRTRPIPGTASDAPSWELDCLVTPERVGNVPRGYLDYLTWQSRRIRLIPQAAEPVTFSRMRMLQGYCTPSSLELHEPSAGYARTKKGEFRARSFQEGRAIWRDCHALIEEFGEEFQPPTALLQLAESKWRGFLDPSRTFVLAALGLSSDQAKVSFWRHETMPLPLTYVGNPELRGDMELAIKAAEDSAYALRRAIRRLAELASQTQDNARPDPQRVDQLAQSLGAEPRYWTRMEPAFREFLLDLPGDAEHRGQCLSAWASEVCRMARKVFEGVVSAADNSPRFLRAAWQSGDTPARWGAVQQLNIELAKIPPKETHDDQLTA
jgi:CRISPR system Cascade subunit CasA